MTQTEVLGEVREALHVREAQSIIETAKRCYESEQVVCSIYDAMDSMPEGVGEEFMRKIIKRELAKVFP